jgi:hypothetical protein
MTDGCCPCRVDSYVVKETALRHAARFLRWRLTDPNSLAEELQRPRTAAVQTDVRLQSRCNAEQISASGMGEGGSGSAGREGGARARS